MADEGLVCIGDSILTPEHSWGYRLAPAGGWPLVPHSARGARSWQVLEQLPALQEHHYAIGALTVGANDVLFDWNAARYEANLRKILETMSATCDRVLVQSLPRAFRRFPGSSPERRANSAAANRILVAATGELGANVVDGSDLSGLLLRPDRVHPSVLGHLLLADRAAAALGLDLRPSSLVRGESNADGRLRYVAVTARITLRELRARLTHAE